MSTQAWQTAAFGAVFDVERVYTEGYGADVADIPAYQAYIVAMHKLQNTHDCINCSTGLSRRTYGERAAACSALCPASFKAWHTDPANMCNIMLTAAEKAQIATAGRGTEAYYRLNMVLRECVDGLDEGLDGAPVRDSGREVRSRHIDCACWVEPTYFRLLAEQLQR